MRREFAEAVATYYMKHVEGRDVSDETIGYVTSRLNPDEYAALLASDVDQMNAWTIEAHALLRADDHASYEPQPNLPDRDAADWDERADSVINAAHTSLMTQGWTDEQMEVYRPIHEEVLADPRRGPAARQFTATLTEMIRLNLKLVSTKGMQSILTRAEYQATIEDLIRDYFAVMPGYREYATVVAEAIRREIPDAVADLSYIYNVALRAASDGL